MISAVPRARVSVPELLAPAGDWDCVRAAVENGADAIYFGLSRFNARMRAHNFTESDLPRLMEFLHLRGVKGYVTFNTLVFENELSEAEDSIRSVIASGVDAAIVQDVGICRLIRSLSPDFPIHCSTQMTITSAAGVEFARELGAQLVVLARENSIADIEKIKAGQLETSGLSPHAPSLPKPPFIGSKVFTDFDVAEVFEYVNERTLFSSQWQFTKAKMKPAEYEKLMRDTAIPTLARLKKQCLAEGILKPAAVCGYYPAAADGNSIVIYDEDRTTERHRFAFPRQDFADNLCLADYLEPADAAGRAIDCLGLFAVTAGQAVSEATKRLYDGGQFTDYLYLHGLGVEFAEALAECFHRRMRAEWGIPDSPSVPVNKLFKGHYRGRRYAFGYPACPNLEDQTGLFALIDPERIGVTLTEQFLLEPEQSTTAIVFHHPAAKYFNVHRTA